MEGKLLSGGNIVDHTNEQQKALEQKRHEIAEKKVGRWLSSLLPPILVTHLSLSKLLVASVEKRKRNVAIPREAGGDNC